MQSLTKGITPYLILAALVFVFYGNTLQNGFVHDDVWQVQRRPIAKVFTGCVAEEIVGGCERGFYWRPMQYVSYYLVNLVSQKPWVFHLVNLVYFWTAGVLVYKLVKILVGIQGQRDKVQKGHTGTNSKVTLYPLYPMSLSHYVPFISAVIFAAHPVNSEVVNWVSATPELLMVVFGLLSLTFFIKYLGSGGVWLALSCAAFLLALLSKETAIVLLLVFAAYLFIVRVKSRTYLNVLAYLVPLFVYLGLRTAVLGRLVYKYEGYYALSVHEQIMTALALFPKYLLKLVWPLPLSFQPLIAPARSFDWQVGMGFLMLAVFGLLGFWAFRRGLKLVAFGLFLIVLGILPPLLFVNKLGQFIFSERYLLFSTVGLTIVLVEVVNMLIRTNIKPIRTNLIFFFLSTVLVLYLALSGFAVIRRNQDWKDNMVSYKAMIRVDDANWSAHLGIARIYEAAGNFEPAKTEFKRVISLDRENTVAKGELAFLENVYSVDGYYSFNFPMGWNVSKDINRVIVSEADVKVEITGDTKKPGQTYDQYLQARKPAGQVVNQGLAQILGMDLSYVRIYQGGTKGERDKVGEGIKGQDLEFFLFKGEKVVRVYLSGAKTQGEMNDFNRILGSIKVEL